jgi:mannosyltransferase
MRRLGHLPLRVWLALALIVLGGATLRLYHLGSESLWSDELESWRQSHFDTLGEVLDYGVRPDTHPPAFQIILFVVEHTLGDSEQALRLPSAIFGILSILVIFWIGARWFSYREGLIAALLMAVLWCPIYFSQEARNYALMLLAALLASAFWAEVANSIKHDLRVGIGESVGYVLTALFACYSHYYGLLLVILQCAALLILAAGKPRDLRLVAALFLGIFLGYLAWIPSAAAQVSHSSLISWMRAPKVTAFPAFISFLFNRWQVLGVMVLLFYAYLLIWRLRRHQQSVTEGVMGLLASGEFVLGYWLVIPLALTWLFSVLQDPIYTQRNLIVSMPAAYLLLSRAIVRLPLRGCIQAGIALVIAGSALYQMLFVMGYYRFPSKEQFREAVEYIINHTDSERSYAVVGYAYYPDYFNYYFERFGSPERVALIAGGAEDETAFDDYLRQHAPERVWYIAAHKPPESGFIEHLMATMELADAKKFLGAQVWLFRYAPANP